MNDPADAPEGPALLSYEGRAMGSPLRLTLPGVGADLAAAERGAAAWDAVVGEFEAGSAVMSRFRGDSELTILNRTAGSGAPTPVSARLRRALAAADRAHRVTGGRFDPRVLEALDRLGYRGAPIRSAAGTPRSMAIAGPVLERVGRHAVRLDHPIDLGGIGKGLTLRWAIAGLARRGVTDVLLEAGGDLVALGRSPAGGSWHVGIEDPAGGDEPLAVVAVTDRAVATSSIRIHRWLAGSRPVHHLLDPRTGEPADLGLVAVTVAGSDPAWAEVWSKALFVGGAASIRSEASSRGLAAWWVATDGTLEMTPAARARTVWVASEAVPVRAG